MDGQWEIHPKKAVVSQQYYARHCAITSMIHDMHMLLFSVLGNYKTELDDFKLHRGIPNCMLLARPLCENFP